MKELKRKFEEWINEEFNFYESVGYLSVADEFRKVIEEIE